MALFQQLRGVESERSFLRDVQRFFVHLFPGVAGMHPSSLHRRVRRLRSYLEPLRRAVVADLIGDPETLVLDSTLLEVLHPREVSQSAGFEGAAWVRWGSFSVYGLKVHLICSVNRVPVSYELTSANTPQVLLSSRSCWRRRCSTELRRASSLEISPTAAVHSERSWQGVRCCWPPNGPSGGRRCRQQVEVCFAALKRVFGMDDTLAKTLVGLATRIVAKIAAYTYGCYVNRLLGRPQGHIKELWA